MRRCLFTLVELLVVIAIIAVLAAMLLPGLTAAKDSAMLINCTSNLRQLAIGFELYADSNDGLLPGDRGIGSDWYVSTATSTGLLATCGIVNDPRLWKCPKDMRPGTWSFSYPMIGRIVAKKEEDCLVTLGGWDYNHCRRVDSFAAPDKAMILGEENAETTIGQYYINDSHFVNDDVFGRRHTGLRGAANHVDGHVETYPFLDNPWKNSRVTIGRYYLYGRCP